MGIARSKTWTIRENLKSKPKNGDFQIHTYRTIKYGKDDCQGKDDTDGSQENDGTDGSQEVDGTDGGQENDDTYCSFNEKDLSTLSYGTHETHESEGGEADLHKHFVSCKKNPGHTEFVPVSDFNINHLPEGYHDNDLVEFIKAKSDLTVRISVTMTSTERPEFWPNTNQPYPFYDNRGSDVMRQGTGMVTYVNKLTKEVINEYSMGTCQCHNCQNLVTPNKVWGEVRIYTATHVVFDDLEARHTTCRLFFDRQDSTLVTLDGWTVQEANTGEDWCVLKCVTCDLDLLNKLNKMVDHRDELWNTVYNKYKSYRDKDKMLFIVSHPHGCPKQISVGRWINRDNVSDKYFNRTKYTYTTPTCPGSSGANVHSLGYDDRLSFNRHVHCGVNPEGINFSATGRDWF